MYVRFTSVGGPPFVGRNIAHLVCAIRKAFKFTSETLLPATTQVTWVQVHVTHIRHGFTCTRSKLTLCLLQVNCHNKVNARMKVEVVQVYITHIMVGSGLRTLDQS